MFHLLARPVIQALAGKPKAQAAPVLAILISRLFSSKGRRNFTIAQLKHDAQGRLVVEPVELVASGAITRLAKTDGYVDIVENIKFIDINEEVKVWLL